MRPYPRLGRTAWVTSRGTFAFPYDFVVRADYPKDRIHPYGHRLRSMLTFPCCSSSNREESGQPPWL
jgi:hypothetical protein